MNSSGRRIWCDVLLTLLMIVFTVFYLLLKKWSSMFLVDKVVLTATVCATFVTIYLLEAQHKKPQDDKIALWKLVLIALATTSLATPLFWLLYRD